MQLIGGTMYNRCKDRVSNPDHHKSKIYATQMIQLNYLQNFIVIIFLAIIIKILKKIGKF